MSVSVCLFVFVCMSVSLLSSFLSVCLFVRASVRRAGRCSETGGGGVAKPDTDSVASTSVVCDGFRTG